MDNNEKRENKNSDKSSQGKLARACRALFITGTGTDVGKTYVAGLIVKKLHEHGKNVGYYKAAMSGNVRDSQGKLIPGDALQVKNISGIAQNTDSMCPYVYEHAVSPHLASRIEGNPVQMRQVRQGFDNLAVKYDYLTVEGSGGIICPICFDEEKIRLEDVVKELDLQSVIVADAGLGTINSVVLTVEYMCSRGMGIKGIILNRYHEGDVMEEDNKFMCEHMTGLKVLACVHEGDTDLDISPDLLASLYE